MHPRTTVGPRFEEVPPASERIGRLGLDHVLEPHKAGVGAWSRFGFTVDKDGDPARRRVELQCGDDRRDGDDPSVGEAVRVGDRQRDLVGGVPG